MPKLRGGSGYRTDKMQLLQTACLDNDVHQRVLHAHAYGEPVRGGVQGSPERRTRRERPERLHCHVLSETQTLRQGVGSV